MTKQLENSRIDDHPELGLIPWYAKGTLSTQEHSLVKQHLATCEPCRQELAKCVALASSLPSSEETWKPSAVHFSGILAEVDKLEAASVQLKKPINAMPALKSGFFQQLANWLQQTPTPVRWTLAVESLAVAILALLIVLPFQPKPDVGGVFETLSNDEKPIKSVGALIRLSLADDMTTKELADLLIQAHAQILQGPSAVGSYTVTLSLEDNAQSLALLRSHPKVRLAQPIETGTAD
jgi:Putative zinc-finger